MLYVPAGVAVVAVTVRALVHVGRHDAFENEAEAPAGNPDALRFTVTGVPVSNVAVKLVPVD